MRCLRPHSRVQGKATLNHSPTDRVCRLDASPWLPVPSTTEHPSGAAGPSRSSTHRCFTIAVDCGCSGDTRGEWRGPLPDPPPTPQGAEWIPGDCVPPLGDGGRAQRGSVCAQCAAPAPCGRQDGVRCFQVSLRCAPPAPCALRPGGRLRWDGRGACRPRVEIVHRVRSRVATA